jgi:hypothetical protein
MKRLFSVKPLIAAAIALGVVSIAQAREDARYPIAVGEPHGQHQPAPAYYRNDRNDRFGPFSDADRDGIPNRFDRDSRFYDARATYRSAQWGDWDRDGVPNTFDRAPRNPRRH